MNDDFDEEEIDELLSELVAEEDAIEAGVPPPLPGHLGAAARC